MDTTINATVRKSTGRGSARQHRREGLVPAIVYGTCDPLPISCSAREIAVRLRDETFHSTVLTLNVEGKKISALLRDVQMHAYKREVMHIDFQAVSESQEIGTSVPLHFINAEEAPGVKLRHGIFTSIENQVEIHCLPKDLPEYINIDVSHLDIGQSVHLSEITPPSGVRFDAITRGDDPALAVMSNRAAQLEETEVEQQAEDSTEETASE